MQGSSEQLASKTQRSPHRRPTGRPLGTRRQHHRSVAALGTATSPTQPSARGKRRLEETTLAPAPGTYTLMRRPCSLPRAHPSTWRGRGGHSLHRATAAPPITLGRPAAVASGLQWWTFRPQALHPATLGATTPPGAGRGDLNVWEFASASMDFRVFLGTF